MSDDFNDYQTWFNQELDNLKLADPSTNKNSLINSISKLNLDGFDLLNFPHYWSGFRLGETQIKLKNATLTDPIAIANKQIKRLKIKLLLQYPFNKEAREQYKKIAKFDEENKKQFGSKVDAWLLNAIYKTKKSIIKDFPSEGKTNSFENNYQQIIAPALLTQINCVKLHKKITDDCSNFRNQLNNENESLQPEINADRIRVILHQVDQYELLCKRYLDRRYMAAKSKKTTIQRRLEWISGGSTLVGLILGILAVVFFLCQMYPLAALFGYLSFISMTSTLISFGQLSWELAHHRPPSSKTLGLFILDVFLTAMGFIGVLAITGVGNGITGLLHLKSKVAESCINFFGTLGNVWDNIISNMVDLLFVSELIAFINKGLSFFLKRKVDPALKHSTSAATLDSLELYFYATKTLQEESEPQSYKKIGILNTLKKQIRNHVTQQQSIKVIPRNAKIIFCYVTNPYVFKTSSPETPFSLFISTHHEAIISWDKDFFSTGTSKEAKALIASVENYKNLVPHASITIRYDYLEKIKEACETYINLRKGSNSRRLPLAENLKTAVEKTIETIQSIQLVAVKQNTSDSVQNVKRSPSIENIDGSKSIDVGPTVLVSVTPKFTQ